MGVVDVLTGILLFTLFVVVSWQLLVTEFCSLLLVTKSITSFARAILGFG